MTLQLDRDLMFELEAALREAFHYALDRDIKSAQFIDAVRRPRACRPMRPGAAP